MALAPGARVGPYEIHAALDAGGMGEVYAAVDPRLGRKIALKLLPPHLAADSQRADRFEREARAVAALTHPNIVTIHSVEHVDGLSFLTMELVEGKTLAELMPRGGFSLERFLQVAIPLADAVAAAHEKGITHRDLKPANVMVTTDGRVKVLDFGLAKLRDESAPAVLDAATEPTRALTGAGQIVGTVAYMSPEQAEGRPVDHRSDLFSLGIVFYEMATGERPFKGDTNVSVLAAIVKDTPRPIAELNPAAPGELARLIRHCLQKDPERRYQSAKDLRSDLETLEEDVHSGTLGAAASQPRASRFRARTLGLAAVALGALAGGYALWPRMAAPARTPAGPVEAAFTQLTFQAGLETFPSLSPDGKWFVYVSAADGDEDIYLQSVGGKNAINLTKDSAANDTQPAFSPDGEVIAFRSEREGGGIFVMGRTGDSVRRVTDGPGFNPSWSPDGRDLVFATSDVGVNPTTGSPPLSELWIARVDTGAKRLLLRSPAGMQPHWSLRGHRIAFTGPGRDAQTIAVTGGPVVPLLADPGSSSPNPVWSPDGRFVYLISDRAGTLNLWRVPADEDSGRAVGPPEPLAAPAPAVAHLSASGDGTRVAYSSVLSRSNIQRLEFDSEIAAVRGQATWITEGSKYWRAVDVSPDGSQLALTSSWGQPDLWLLRTDGSGLQQITNDLAIDLNGRWSRDGRAILFTSGNRGGDDQPAGPAFERWQTWAINADGSRLRQLSTSDAVFERVVLSPDGARIATVSHPGGQTAAITWDPSRPFHDQQPERLPPWSDVPGFHLMSWSPDGKRLAGDISGGGIFVYSFESQQYERLTDFGGLPRWLSDGRRLLFIARSKLFVVDRETQRVREVFSAAPDLLRDFAVAPDGRSLYLARGPEESDIWMATLK